jgi:hypothetical protein
MWALPNAANYSPEKSSSGSAAVILCLEGVFALLVVFGY